MPPSPRQLQHDFYTATAEAYDRDFVHQDDEHGVALSHVSAYVAGFGYASILDVGAGTGRGVRHLLDRHPDIEVRGIEPVRAMIETAERNRQIPAGCIAEGRGDPLPFATDSFDAVCEFGVLHHVENPGEIVREMTRVARRAVFISDDNRFARGSAAARLSKYALYRTGLWPLVWRLRTRGRGYHVTDGDGGVAYSYSVYESLDTLTAWADRVFLIPTSTARSTWFHPLFSATHVLVCALRDR